MSWSGAGDGGEHGGPEGEAAAVPIRVVLVDDHPIFRNGLRSLLSADRRFEVTGEAADGQEALEVVERLRPDVVIMDLSLPRLGGIQAIQRLGRSRPEARILVLSMHDDQDHVGRALDAGASGYLVKTASVSEIRDAVLAVSQGESALSPSISRDLIRAYVEGRKAGAPERPATVGLTDREREILQLLVEGLSNTNIAARLSLSEKTVQTHRANIMRKLGCHRIADLMRVAIKEGLVEL